jgi:hypothetical protein
MAIEEGTAVSRYGKRRPLAAASVALVCSLLTACGSSPPNASAQSGHSTPAVRSTNASVSLTAVQLSAKINTAIKSRDTVAFTVGQAGTDYGDGPVRATGVARWGTSGFQARVSTGAAGRDLTVILAGTDMYVTGIPTGNRSRPWIKISASGTDPVSKQLRPVLQRTTSSIEPLAVAKVVPRLVFTDTGSSTISGTHEYHAHLSTQQWLQTLAPGTRAAASQWASRETVSGEDVLVFLDANGLPVNEILAVTPSTAQVTYETDYSGWGQPVDLALPGPDKVVEAPRVTV